MQCMDGSTAWIELADCIGSRPVTGTAQPVAPVVRCMWIQVTGSSLTCSPAK